MFWLPTISHFLHSFAKLILTSQKVHIHINTYVYTFLIHTYKCIVEFIHIKEIHVFLFYLRYSLTRKSQALQTTKNRWKMLPKSWAGQVWSSVSIFKQRTFLVFRLHSDCGCKSTFACLIGHLPTPRPCYPRPSRQCQTRIV